MFRPQTDHHQVVHLLKRAEGCTVYNVCCILYSLQPFSVDVQPDDGLFEVETCSCLAVTISSYI